MKKLFKFLIVTFMIIALIGCSQPPTNDEDSKDSEFVEYGVAGEITEISEDVDTNNFRILVKGNEDNGATYTQAWVTINEETKIYKNDLVKKDQLELNMYVHVFFDGPVAESFPVQGTAKQINIVEKNQEGTSETNE